MHSPFQQHKMHNSDLSVRFGLLDQPTSPIFATLV